MSPGPATGSVSRGRDPGDTMANINFKMPKARPRLLGQLVDPKAHTRVYSYLFQCGLATIFLIAALLLHDAVLRAAIIVAVASSAFIIFVVPDSVAATPRRVIGGHIVAIIIGTIFAAIAGSHEESSYFVDIMAALSVGLSILLMVSTNTEHPALGPRPVRLSQCQSDWTKMDSNAPLAVGAGLKPAQPLQQDADAIFIPLCGLHKNIVIPNAATAE